MFFVKGIGLVSSVDPYEVLDLPYDEAQGALRVRFDADGADGDELRAACRALLADPARRLAWHLLRPPAQAPGAAAFVRRGRCPELRRSCAAHLLAEAIGRELGGPTGRLLEELWDEVDCTWEALRESSASLAALAALGGRLEMERPEDAAGAALAAVKSELLPSLHALFGVRADDPQRREFHLGRVGDADTELVALCRSVLQSRELAKARRERAKRRHVLALKIYASIKASDADERARISAEIGELADEIASDADPFDPLNAHNLDTALDAAAAAFPFDHRACAARSRLEVRRGLSCAEGGRLNEAALHFARAAALDAGNPDPPVLLDLTREKLASIAAQLGAVTASGQKLNDRGSEMLREVEAGLVGAAAFAASSDAQRLHGRCIEAVWAQLAARLNLDPTAPDHLAAAQQIAQMLVEHGEARPPFEQLEERARLEIPLADRAPWPALRALFEEAAPVSAAALADRLPAPPPLPERDLTDGLLLLTVERLRDASRARDPRPRWLDPNTIYPWLFSRRGAGVKALAVAGLAMMVTGAAMMCEQVYSASRRDAAYGELRAAVAASRTGEVIAAARAFVDRTERGFNDHRIPEVASEYRRALLHEITRTAEEGRTGDAGRLIEEARALREWAALDQGDRGHEETRQ
ncbi:hypothetical protein [Sorangium sp. So ce1389]|uniref:hypothetical protein n=1 Tax=Sorangium sp. So ce1389 TaxID=3133336 RepID=UPI003F60CC28